MTRTISGSGKGIGAWWLVDGRPSEALHDYDEAVMHYRMGLDRLRVECPRDQFQRTVIAHMAVMDARMFAFYPLYGLAADTEPYTIMVNHLAEELRLVMTRSAAFAVTVHEYLGNEPEHFIEALDRACWLAGRVERLSHSLANDAFAALHAIPSMFTMEEVVPPDPRAMLNRLATAWRALHPPVSFRDGLDMCDYIF